MEGEGSGSDLAGGGLHAWQSTSAASALNPELPLPLGEHSTGGGSVGLVLNTTGGGLPTVAPALAASAMRASGACVAAWPLVWYAAVVPQQYLSSPTAGAAALRLFGSLAQRSVKGVTSVASSPAGGAHPLSWAVLEAHLVLLGARGAPNTPGGRAPVEDTVGATVFF